jgi:hypothetical protein
VNGWKREWQNRIIGHGKPPLGHILDVYGDGGKMLNLHWDNDGNIEIVSFKRGDWEEEILDAVAR